MLDDLDERTTVLVETVAEGRIRDFLGFNRAPTRRLEAAILATRVALIPMSEILGEFHKLSILVDKTGGPTEHAAFDLLETTFAEPANVAPFDPKASSP